jgi:dienelactone hydrolase
MKPLFFLLTLLAGTTLFTACNNDSTKDTTTSQTTDTMVNTNTNAQAIVEQPVTYSSGNTTMNGYFAYDSASTAKKPIVLVVHEWWGLTDYPRMRARMLAQLGYLAMAVDMYGGGKIAANPEEAQNTAMPFYKNPQEAKARLDAALAEARKHPQADTSKTAAIGYCFGGTMVLNAAKLGSDFDGVVSFHGGLEGVTPVKGQTKAQMLILHGGADSFVPQAQVDAFRKSLDSVGARYSFKVYDNATHAFTNPDADKKAKEFGMPIKYNGAADTASWNDMKAFLQQVFQ